MANRRRLTRPRTKVYDCNYSLGEDYYRSALDGLDRKYGKLPAETIEAPKRPVSVGDIESMLGAQREQTAASLAALAEKEDEQQMADTLLRIRKARSAYAPTPEADFENTFMNRREEVKKRFNEKMLDSVGLNGILEGDNTTSSSTIRRRALKLVSQTEEDAPKFTKWTALRDPIDNADELAAKARARASKARLADIEAEMDELAERGAARERRLAGLRQLLDDSENLESSSSSSMRMRKKITTTSITSEKRIM